MIYLTYEKRNLMFPEFCHSRTSNQGRLREISLREETMRQAKDFYARFERIVSFIVAGKVKKYYGTIS